MKKERQSQPEPISLLLSRFLQTNFTDKKQNIFYTLCSQWADISRHLNLPTESQPVKWEKGKLTVWTESAVQVQELSFYKEELKFYINSHFKNLSITDIYFTINKQLLKAFTAKKQLLNGQA